MTLKDSILQAKKDHPDWGCREISLLVGCSHSMVHYYLHPNGKEMMLNRQRKRRNANPVDQKLESFVYEIIRRRKKKFNKVIREGKNCDNRTSSGNKINAKELFEKLKTNPVCYLTGRKIDLFDTKSYNFDHIVPIAQGGGNDINNLGLVCEDANMAKHAKNPQQFFDLCREVLEYNGYKVTRM